MRFLPGLVLLGLLSGRVHALPIGMELEPLVPKWNSVAVRNGQIALRVATGDPEGAALFSTYELVIRLVRYDDSLGPIALEPPSGTAGSPWFEGLDARESLGAEDWE